MNIRALTGAVALCTVAAFGMTPLSTAIAAGGGGGGGGQGPSSSGPSYDPAEEYRKGVQYLQDGDYKKAERAFKKVLKVAPKDANTNYLMGLAQLGQDNDKGARRYLRKAVRYDGELTAARGKLGAVEARLGDMDKAQEQVAALEAMAAQCADSCSKASAIRTALAEVNAAMSGGEQVSFNYDGWTLAALGDAAYLDAVRLINLEQYGKAQEQLASASRVFGPHPDVLTYQGFINRKMGNYDVAKAYYSLALEIAPDHRGANEYLGELYVEQRNGAAAIAQLAKLETICTFGCEEAEELRRWIKAADLL